MSSPPRHPNASELSTPPRHDTGAELTRPRPHWHRDMTQGIRQHVTAIQLRDSAHHPAMPLQSKIKAHHPTGHHAQSSLMLRARPRGQHAPPCDAQEFTHISAVQQVPQSQAWAVLVFARFVRRGSFENISTIGSSRPTRRWIRLTANSSSQSDSVTTTPDSPALAVRPARCR